MTDKDTTSPKNKDKSPQRNDQPLKEIGDTQDEAREEGAEKP